MLPVSRDTNFSPADIPFTTIILCAWLSSQCMIYVYPHLPQMTEQQQYLGCESCIHVGQSLTRVYASATIDDSTISFPLNQPQVEGWFHTWESQLWVIVGSNMLIWSQKELLASSTKLVVTLILI